MASFIGFAPADASAVRHARRARREQPELRRRGRGAGVLRDHAVRVAAVRREPDRPRRTRSTTPRRRPREPPATRARSRTAPTSAAAQARLHRPSRRRPTGAQRTPGVERRVAAAAERPPIACLPTRPSTPRRTVLLHDLLDDLELRDHLLEVRGDTDIDLGVDRARQPGGDSRRVVLLHPRRAQRRSRPRAARRSRPARSRCSSSACSRSTFRRCASTRSAACSVRCARVSTGYPSRALRVLGVTGTNGKTSTTYLLEAIARANGDRAGVIGTVEARIDGTVVPLQPHDARRRPTCRRCSPGCATAGVDTVAMEVSSHALDQHRVDGTRFAAVTFTNLTHEHLDYHPTVEAYFEAKASLFDPRFSAAGRDQHRRPHGVELRRPGTRRAACRSARTRSTTRPPTCTRATCCLRRDETLFELVDNRHDHHGVVRSPLVGRFNVANALAAAATALVVGFSFEAVLAGLGAPVRVPGRFERVGDRSRFRGARRLRAHARRAGVGARARPARWSTAGSSSSCSGAAAIATAPSGPLMGEVATRLADTAILTSDNPRSEDPERDRARRARRHPRRPRRARRSSSTGAPRSGPRCAAAGAGDVVVIAGKGHETGQTSAGVTTPFDDRRRCRRGAGGVLVTRAHRPGDRAPRRRARSSATRRDRRCVGVRFARCSTAGACFVALQRRARRPRLRRRPPSTRARASRSSSRRFRRWPGARDRARAGARRRHARRAAAGRAYAARRPTRRCTSWPSAGSTGKTSTKDLLAAVLVSRGCHANAESYNNEFGLPITLCNAPDAAHVVVYGDGGAVRGRPRSAVRHRRVPTRGSSPTSASRTPSTSAARPAS